MKPIVESLAYPVIGSIRCGEYFEQDFEYPFHIHPEYEFTCMLEGEGRQVVGDNISQYGPGELVFIGPNLPHSWQITYDKKIEHRDFRLLNLQFRDESFGSEFFSLPEMKRIRKLLDSARYGLVVQGQTRQKITALMQQIVHQQDFSIVLSMLHILDILSQSDEYRICSSLGYIPSNSTPQEMERIRLIHQYVMEHYCRTINLQEIAKQLGFTQSSFCHYFKKRTGRPFIRYVNEIRIRHACRLLQESTMSITDVCYESGFNNLSFFNRVFLRTMHSSPGQFRKNQAM